MKPAPPVTRMRCMLRLSRDCNRSARERPRRYNAPTMDAPPVQYVTTSDGYSIAYIEEGEGHPLVLLGFPPFHLRLTNAAPVRGSLPRALAQRFRLVQFDPRGYGLST